MAFVPVTSRDQIPKATLVGSVPPVGQGLSCRSFDEMQRLVMPSLAPPQQGGSVAYRDAFIAASDDPSYGLHQNPNKPDPSEDVLSREGFGVDEHSLQWFDFSSVDITGAADGANPTKAFLPVTEYRDGATFVRVREDRRVPVRVTGRDIGRLSVSGTGWTLNGQPWQYIGKTAFDLPVRLHKTAAGEAPWLDWMVAKGFTLARVVAYTVAARLPRQPDAGLEMLPLTLAALADRGLCAQVVIFCDGAWIGLTVDQAERYVDRVGQKLSPFRHWCVDLFNEIGHPSQPEWAKDPAIRRHLRSILPAEVPVSMGSSHGADQPVGLWDLPTGDFVTVHGNRAKSPEHNADLAAAYQQSAGKPVSMDEEIGCDEVDKPGRRSNDPELFARQGRAARERGLSAVLHTEAGLSATMPFLGPVHQESAARFVAEIRRI